MDYTPIDLNVVHFQSYWLRIYRGHNGSRNHSRIRRSRFAICTSFALLKTTKIYRCFPGRRYDENGNLKQWWSLATLEHYHNRVQCIVDQYSNYSMPDLGPTFSVSFDTVYINSRTTYLIYVRVVEASWVLKQKNSIQCFSGSITLSGH